MLNVSHESAKGANVVQCVFSLYWYPGLISHITTFEPITQQLEISEWKTAFPEMLSAYYSAIPVLSELCDYITHFTLVKILSIDDNESSIKCIKYFNIRFNPQCQTLIQCINNPTNHWFFYPPIPRFQVISNLEMSAMHNNNLAVCIWDNDFDFLTPAQCSQIGSIIRRHPYSHLFNTFTQFTDNQMTTVSDKLIGQYPKLNVLSSMQMRRLIRHFRFPIYFGALSKNAATKAFLSKHKSIADINYSEIMAFCVNFKQSPYVILKEIFNKYGQLLSKQKSFAKLIESLIYINNRNNNNKSQIRETLKLSELVSVCEKKEMIPNQLTEHFSTILENIGLSEKISIETCIHTTAIALSDDVNGIHSNDKTRILSTQFENSIISHFSKFSTFKTENDLHTLNISPTPDLYFGSDGVNSIRINGNEVNWIEIKNFFVHTNDSYFFKKIVEQISKYTYCYGNGALLCCGFDTNVVQSLNAILRDTNNFNKYHKKMKAINRKFNTKEKRTSAVSVVKPEQCSVLVLDASRYF